MTCASRVCRREFTPRDPRQRFCDARCKTHSKGVRQWVRRQVGGVRVARYLRAMGARTT